MSGVSPPPPPPPPLPTPLPTPHPVSPPIDSSSTTTTDQVSPPNDNDTTTTTNNLNNDCYTNNKYHPTSIHEKKCTNNHIYPQLWTATNENIQKYFFNKVEECCNAFYNGQCDVIEDICIDTDGVTTDYYDGSSGSGSGGNKYYPDLNSGTCLNDGNESDYQVNLFDTLEECVSYNFPLCVCVFLLFCRCFVLLSSRGVANV